jgi:hypothetical protein
MHRVGDEFERQKREDKWPWLLGQETGFACKKGLLKFTHWSPAEQSRVTMGGSLGT